MTYLRITFALLALSAGCGTSTTPGNDAASLPDTGIDAYTSPGDDAATTHDDAGTIGNGVRCGPNDCTAGQVCCSGSTGLTCVAAGTGCTGGSLACDGPEDCASGEQCCNDDAGNTACSANACTGYHICHAATDCAAGESCCPNGGGQPLGSYQHCTTLAAGTSCPLPP